jgi:hypothetical protein
MKQMREFEAKRCLVLAQEAQTSQYSATLLPVFGLHFGIASAENTVSTSHFYPFLSWFRESSDRKKHAHAHTHKLHTNTPRLVPITNSFCDLVLVGAFSVKCQERLQVHIRHRTEPFCPPFVVLWFMCHAATLRPTSLQALLLESLFQHCVGQ